MNNLSIKAIQELKDVLKEDLGIDSVSKLDEEELNDFGFFILSTLNNSIKRKRRKLLIK